MDQATPLDPVSALAYYLCVAKAIERGRYLVPSSHEIADLLELRKGERVALHDETQRLWEDLWWLKEKKIPFDERPADAEEYWRRLSQHNVNAKMRSFRPGFAHGENHERYIVPFEFVERPRTALRLIALKEYFRFNREVPHPSYFKFLRPALIPTEGECYTFLHSMHRVHYVQVLPSDEWLPKTATDPTAFLEPSDTFRNQDLYLELRALDEFSRRAGDPVRRKRRLDLQRDVERFVGAQVRRSQRKPKKD
jgi:hypothetical protein